MIVITTSKVYSVKDNGVTVTDLSGALTANTSQIGRMTTLALGSGGSITNYLVITNGKDTPKKWDGAAASVSAVAGTPPLWTDITTIDDKIIGIVPPYSISWGATRAIDVWPALNFKLLAETADPLIAIVPGPTPGGGTVYKRDSIWNIVPTGNTSDASAFRFPPAETSDGPASPAAVFRTPYGHARMTANGRVGLWDGTKTTWIADSVWASLRAVYTYSIVDTASMHGWYDPDFDELHFSWHLGAYNASFPTRIQYELVLTRIPGTTQFASWLNTYNAQLYPASISDPNLPASIRETTHGSGGGCIRFGCFFKEPAMYSAMNWRFASHDGVANSGAIYSESALGGSLADYMDNGSGALTKHDIYGWMETGLQPMPELETHRIESVEIFASRGYKYGKILLTPRYAYTLAKDGNIVFYYYGNLVPGQVGKAVNVSLESSPDSHEPIRAEVGLDITARFFGFQLFWDTADPSNGAITFPIPKYRGAMLKSSRVTV